MPLSCPFPNQGCRPQAAHPPPPCSPLPPTFGSTRTMFKIHVNHNQLHSYRPVLGHGTRLPGIRWNHARERRAFTRHMCSASREGVTQQADLSAGFNLQTAVNLACCAFESYLDPPVEDQSLWQVHTSANGVKTTYVERRFLTDSFDGLVSVEVMSASDLPERDTLGGSNPYAVVSIGESSGRTETVAWGAEPTFNEKFYLFVRSPEKDVLVVRMFDEDPAKSDDSLGAAMLPVRSLLDGKHHDLEMELRGDGGGGKLKLSARFLR
ncbi:unnamed protein product [Ostreobium quekettii]|uniref:C2 domain-containing protein n=1 Tax=Ostreobium quekettii TaxID=121088 RepID=A0A8S1IZ34_9CHLO|nr:unnamed protein product [Ostreobium quekettii]